MAQTLALIHTSPTLTPMFRALCAAEMSDVEVFHMVDESLIQDTIRSGRLRGTTIRRLLWQIESAEAAGADAIMVTCSSIGPGVALARSLFELPVIRIDEAMAEEAVRMGRRIGVAATLRTTLEPTIELLKAKAAQSSNTIEIVESLSQGAFEAVLAGDVTTHDRILAEKLVHDLHDVDVIVLAQASMARVVSEMPAGTLRIPVLSSPELAVRRAKKILLGLRANDLVGAPR
jgi:Asp/Glu/hydantoin racemase